MQLYKFKRTKMVIFVLLKAFSGFKRTKSGVFVLLRLLAGLFVGDTVAKKGEVAEAWVVRPYVLEGVGDLPGRHDVLLLA